MKQLVFYFDIVCPFAYIASFKLSEELIKNHPDVEFIFEPVLLGGIYDKTNATQGKTGSATNVMAVQKQRVVTNDLLQSINRMDIDFTWHSAHPVKSLYAVRLLHLVKSQSDRRLVTRRLFEAYWSLNLDLSDINVLLDVVKDVNVTWIVDELTYEVVRSHSVAAKKLREATEKAVELGAPGVPSFWLSHSMIDGQPSLFYGQDRFQFVLSSLKGRAVPFEAFLHQKLISRHRRLTFYWDISSPWSFLAWTQFRYLSSLMGPNVNIEHCPILVGALFKQISTPIVPLLSMPQAKVAYNYKDLNDWVWYWNHLEGANTFKFKYPTVFPIRSVLPQRIAIAHPELVDLMFYSAWTHDIPLGDESVLRDLLQKNGFDSTQIINDASSQQVKDRLRANNERALNAGCCGVPSFQVDNGPVIWGQDRWDVILEELSTVKGESKI